MGPTNSLSYLIPSKVYRTQEAAKDAVQKEWEKQYDEEGPEFWADIGVHCRQLKWVDHPDGLGIMASTSGIEDPTYQYYLVYEVEVME